MERNRTLLSAGLTLALAVGTLGGCATAPAKVASPAPASPAQKAPEHKPAAAPEQPVLAGKVVETMDGGGYTYVLIEKEGKKSWSAIPQTEVKVGQDIILTPGIDMANFTSNTLKRTFESIHFSSGIQGEKPKMTATMMQKPAAGDASKLPPNHPAISQADAKAAADSAPGASAPPITGTVVESLNAGGYTYLSIEKEGKKSWVAIPQEDVAVGAKVAVQPGAVMPSFKSKSLNRTFDNIVFSSGLAK